MGGGLLKHPVLQLPHLFQECPGGKPTITQYQDDNGCVLCILCEAQGTGGAEADVPGTGCVRYDCDHPLQSDQWRTEPTNRGK